MKKFALLFACAAVALMTACEGDNPSGTGGDMPVVTGVAVNWDASSGVDIVLTWTAVEDAEGYKVWFSQTSGGTPQEVGDVATTTFTHTASSAGYYYVTAYEDDDASSGYSAAVNTLPNIITTPYIIYDNNAPETYHSGFKFGFEGGQTGLAGSMPFAAEKDIYAYESDPVSPQGIAFCSGDAAPFGGGHHTEMAAADGGSVSVAPASGYWVSGNIIETDVIFCKLFDGYYAKIIVGDIEGPVGGSTNGTSITFTYEIQTHAGIRLFTTSN
ncbi:MAG TPA: hypothetical protein PLX54_08250 [Candidatus Fermentibacter daniensis]|nr:hypothetical protein [Candidatus Fermentibacter daniensis]HOR07137.1 hypothetical protein [Candidatus Fermentibacter daniensis]HPK52345.1 hypothetical protein [Candidatus Fermentibacter daniensis]